MASETYQTIIKPEELEKNNGKDGAPAYIAYKGRVYDVSQSKLWRGGQHMKRHAAGADLTTDLQHAPHAADVLERCPQVGVLPGAEPEGADTDSTLPWILQRFPMLKRHPHPMTVHFPIAFSILAPLFAILFVITGYAPLETTSFHLMACGVLFTPVAMLTGLYTWKLNYMSQLMKPVRIKLLLTPSLFVLTLTGFWWRLNTPDALYDLSGTGFLYLLLHLAHLPLITLIGWHGAAMTFPPEAD